MIGGSITECSRLSGPGGCRKSLSQTANAKFRDARPMLNGSRALVKLQTDFRFGTRRRRLITFTRFAPFVRARRVELAVDSVAFDHQTQPDGERIQRDDRDRPRL